MSLISIAFFELLYFPTYLTKEKENFITFPILKVSNYYFVKTGSETSSK